MKKFVPHLISVAIFVAISAIYFSPVFEGKVLSAHDIDTWKGMSKEVQDFRVETGEEALWTKTMFSGMPAYQISTRSNGNLIQYIDKIFRFGLPRPMDMLFMYLIGFYILLLTLKIDYKLAIVGAIGFAFSSYFIIIIQAGHMTKAHAIAYLPLIIASVLYTFRSKKWLLGAVFTSLFVALQLYSNHYQITYYTIIILFFIGIVEFVKGYNSKNPKNQNLILSIISSVIMLLFIDILLAFWGWDLLNPNYSYIHLIPIICAYLTFKYFVPSNPNFFKRVGILIIAALLGGATNYTRLATTMEYGPETQRGKSELVNEIDTDIVSDWKKLLDIGAITQKEFDKRLGDTITDGLDLKYATTWSYGKAETMTFLIPNFMGGSTGTSVLENKDSETLKYLRGIRNQKKQQKLQQQTMTYWGDQPGTSPTYVGSIIMFLFVLGIMYVRSSYRIWILLATILSIMLGWGSNFMGLTEFFFNYVPAYNKFRAVTMAMIIAEFGIALLAILALNKFLISEKNPEKEQKLKIAFYITGGITLLFALVPSFFVDFLSSNDYLNNNIDFTSRLASDRESIMKSDAWRSFIFILLSAGTLWMFVKGNLKKQYVVIILGVLLLSDLWSVDKRYLNETHFVKETKSSFIPSQADRTILKKNATKSRVFNYNNPFNESKTSFFHNSIGGYHAAKLLRYQELIDNQLSQNNVLVLSMLNCGWIITPQGEAVESKLAGINPLGDAWFVSDIQLVEDANKEMDALNSFNPATTAIVDKRFSESITDFTLDVSATINLNQKDYKPNHLTYNLTNITSTQLSVFSEIYYEKGWNAYINGEIVPHFRVNYVLRAMMVPAGTTKIEFKFEPTSYSTGENIAYASSIFLLLLIGFVSYKELK